MKIEIMIADETGEIEIVNKVINEQDYEKVIRELESQLKQEGENRHIEEVMILQPTQKPTQPTQIPSESQSQHLNNDEYFSIKHKKKVLK